MNCNAIRKPYLLGYGFLCLKTIFLVLLILSIPAKTFSQELDSTSETTDQQTTGANDADQTLAQESFDRINDVIKRMFNEILILKDKHKELASFDATALTKNQYGFYTLQYQTEVPSAGGKTMPFAFGLTVEIPKDKNFKKSPGYFIYPLPFLGLQLAGYTIKHPFRRQFDISALVDKYGEDLVDYQQKFMPLQFVILPTKKSYRVGEEIRFRAILANVSKHNVLVNSLSKKSLYFTLNNQAWGILHDAPQEVVESSGPYEQLMKQQEAMIAQMEAMFNSAPDPGVRTERGMRTKVGEQIILRSGEALMMDFTGESYSHPMTVDIRGIYQLNIKGLKPTCKLSIKIIE